MTATETAAEPRQRRHKTSRRARALEFYADGLDSGAYVWSLEIYARGLRNEPGVKHDQLAARPIG